MLVQRLALFIAGCASCLFIGCVSESSENEAGEKIVVRLPSDPDRIHPVLSSSGHAQQIENLMFSPMLEYNPYTLERELVLARERPKVSHWIKSGDTLGLRIQYEIKSDASWENGEPVTGADYHFTLKSVLNPKVNAARMRGYLNYVRSVEVDRDNPKRFTVYASGNYFLAEPVSSMIHLLPKHHYDPEGWMDTFSISTLRGDLDRLSEETVALLDSFAVQFSSPTYSREIPTGSGPYRLVDWTSDQRLVLQKKDKWWGDTHRGENDFFEVNPPMIQYVIMSDEVGAVSALKAGQIDLISEISPQQFQDIQREQGDRFHFFSPSLFQYYFVGLNNRDPRLDDRRVRRALMHLLNVDKIQTLVLDSLAQRIIGPIHPSKPYYNDTLNLIPYDPEKANELLDASGWTDTDGDGIRDKLVDGERVDLRLQLNSTGSQIGKQISLIFREGASKGGVEVDIVNQEFRLTIQDLRDRSFQMALLVNTQYAFPEDPYQTWHTDNDRPDGGNYYGFGDAESDRIIDSIRVTLDADRREHWYKRFQEIIYHRQPVLFMVAPRATVVLNNRWEAREAARHPGYFLPHMTPKQ